MEVHPDEGGVTKHIGGAPLIVLPAGYLGSAFWGMGLVIASADQLGSEIAAGILIFFLLVFIWYAKNCYLRTLNLGFIVLLGVLLAVNLNYDENVLEYATLFIGVMSCLFSVYDIWDDLIARRVNESDASRFAEITHTSSRCWGVIWGLIAVASLGAAIYFNLLLLDNDGPQVNSVSELSPGAKGALSFAAIVFGLGIIHTAITRRCMIRLGSRRADGDYYSA